MLVAIKYTGGTEEMYNVYMIEVEDRTLRPWVLYVHDTETQIRYRVYVPYFDNFHKHMGKIENAIKSELDVIVPEITDNIAIQVRDKELNVLITAKFLSAHINIKSIKKRKDGTIKAYKVSLEVISSMDIFETADIWVQPKYLEYLCQVYKDIRYFDINKYNHQFDISTCKVGNDSNEHRWNCEYNINEEKSFKRAKKFHTYPQDVTIRNPWLPSNPRHRAFIVAY